MILFTILDNASVALFGAQYVLITKSFNAYYAQSEFIGPTLLREIASVLMDTFKLILCKSIVVINRAIPAIKLNALLAHNSVTGKLTIISVVVYTLLFKLTMEPVFAMTLFIC